MAPITTDASLGLVTARDPSSLKPGELAEAVGCEYRIGSPHLYKQNGRIYIATVPSSAAIRALHRFQYDTGDDVLVAVTGDKVYEGAVSTSPTLTTVGLSGLGTTVIPHFVGYQDEWLMCAGDSGNYVREASGTWHINGLARPSGVPTAASVTGSSTAQRPTTDTGSYTNPTRAYDTDSGTYGIASVGITDSTTTHTFTIGTNVSGSGRRLFIDHEGNTVSAPPGPSHLPPKLEPPTTSEEECIITVEYSTDGGTNFEVIRATSGLTYFNRVTDNALLDDSLNFNTTPLIVRVTTEAGVHKIYDIRVSVGASTAVTAENPITYGYREVFTDTNDQQHASNLSQIAEIAVADFTGIYGITLTLPAKTNTQATSYEIFRSVDEDGGGYPNMYRVGTTTAGAGTWVDDFFYPIDEIPDTVQLPTLTVLFADGQESFYEPNGQAPNAILALPYSGAMAYVPVDPTLSHRVYYSLASTLSPVALEQVPAFQYLDFQTPTNDTITSMALTNGGRSLLAFFNGYTMIVNYLPQSTDGIFDNRVKEYVSNTRGCAGVHACCEFSLPSGQTLVAAVDALGLWVTNGVSEMTEWSRDLDWDTLFDGVDLSTVQLVDNTEKRRVELLFIDTAGDRQEMHLFYGRMKQGEAGLLPLVTGPHPMGVRCKHYCQLDTAWEGFSGSAAADGKVYLEESGFADEAQGYDATGIVPFTFTLGDVYVAGLGASQLVESSTPKFAATLSKSFTMRTALLRDKGYARTITKTFAAGTQSKVYIHGYCDRYRVTFSDLTATEAPPFIGNEIRVRGAGDKRDS